jgi:hypothetical protein
LILWLLVYWVRHVCDALLDTVGYTCFARGKLRHSQARNSGLVQEEERWEDAIQGFEQGEGRSRVVVKQEITGVKEDKTDEEYWREYFATPTNWWDNRQGKRNPRAPDFKHRITRKALWINGWFTPQWMKDRFLMSSLGI